MSETANKLFNALAGIKEAVLTVAPGVLNFGPEVKAEMSRLRTQGSSELANALFGNGSAFVLYGEGQKAIKQLHATAQEHPHTQDGQEHGRGR